MILSIIIPVYNVENFVEKCLRSCEKQDISSNEYEIIVVNDGSKDNSLKIVEYVSRDYNNIKIISQSNGGLSVARNTGLKEAKGEYVWFVDSDDWLEENCLNHLCFLCKNVDVLHVGHNKVDGDKVISNKAIITNASNPLLNRNFPHCVPFYIMRRELLISNKLQFMAGVFHEDMEFTPRMLYYAKSIMSTDLCVYNYLHRTSSIMSTINPKRAFDLIIVMNSLYKFEKSIIDRTYEHIYVNLISLGINNALYIISRSKKEEQIKWLKLIFIERHLLDSLKKSSIIKYKIQGYLFTMKPGINIIKLYRFMQWFKKIINK